MSDSEEAVTAAPAVGKASLPDGCQEIYSAHPPYVMGYIYLRRAMTVWHAEAETRASIAQRYLAVLEHRGLRRKYDATTSWRIRIKHQIMLSIYRDRNFQRQRFYRKDLLSRLRSWEANYESDPVVNYDDWPEGLEISRITGIQLKARVPGKMGHPGKEVTFFTKDGSRAVMTLKVFRQSTYSQGALDVFRAEEREAIEARSKSLSKRNDLSLLLKSKSLARFRSRASSILSSDGPNGSDEDSDFQMSPTGSDGIHEDRMAIIIADRMGSESLAPSFRPRRKQAPSIKHKAVAELQQSLDVLQQAELQAESGAEGSLVSAADKHFESLRAARESADLTRRKDAYSKDAAAIEEETLSRNLEAAQVSSELRAMVAQSGKQNQSEVQAQLFAAKIATIEQSLADVIAANKELRTAATNVTHARQYSNEAEMKLEAEIDKVTHIHAEDYAITSQSGQRTCLIASCNAKVLRNKKVCLMGHPADIRMLKCPWPGCGEPCHGTTEQKLVQPLCLRCGRPLIHSQTDQLIKLELMKLVAELAEKDGSKYDSKPKGTLALAMSKKEQHITESECKWFRLLRLANDPENSVVAPDAHKAIEGLEELVAICTQVPISKLLGHSVDFKLTERAFWAMFKGASAGRGYSFKIYELAQIAGCSQDKAFLAWTKNCCSNGMPAEPNWDDPAAATWLRQFLDAFTVLLTHVVSSHIGKDHAEAVEVFMTAMQKEGPIKVRFAVEMLYNKHAAWFAHHHTMGIIYVEDSSYFDSLYGDFVLWNNPGTSMQAPKLAARWFKDGVAVWHPVFEELFDEPARLWTIQDAHSRLSVKKIGWGDRMGGAGLSNSSEVKFAAFDSKSFEIYNSALSQGKDFCCMDTNGCWHSVGWHACHRCLKESCRAASADKCNGAAHSHSLNTSKGGYRIHFASIQKALENSDRVEDIAADYLRIVTSRSLKPEPSAWLECAHGAVKLYGPQPIPYGYTMKDGSPMLACESKECLHQSKAYEKYVKDGKAIPLGMSSKYGGSGQGMFTTTADHSADAAQRGEAYAARRRAATVVTQQGQPSTSKSKQRRKKAAGTTPAAPEPADTAPAAKKKPTQKKAAAEAQMQKRGQGAAAEADSGGKAPTAKPRPKPKPKPKPKPEPKKTDANTHATNVPMKKYGRSNSNGAFDAWIKGCPEGRSDLQQPRLEDNEARWEFGSHVTTGKQPVSRTLPATLVMPSLSGGKDHRFKATGSDIGEDIILPDGTVERRNCTIKSVCHHKQIDECAVLLKAKSDSKKFVLASPEVQRKFAHLNHLEHTDEYVNNLYGSFSDVAANNQPKNYFWVRGGWLKEFGEGPIALWMEEAGKVQLKIYVLCSSERNSSKLESLVTHILARQGHAYWLKWDDGLEALKDVLMVAPYLYRYVDTSIEPCVYLEDTLKARTPMVPKFLTAKASFQTMIETGQKLGACPRFGSGSAGEGQPYHPELTAETNTRYCTSCKKTKHVEGFKGKTCNACLDVRRAKYVSTGTQKSRHEAQSECNKALSTAITEIAGECAWLIETLCWELIGKDSATSLQEVKTWIMKVYYSLSKLTAELLIPLGTRLFIVTSTSDALDTLKQVFIQLTIMSQTQQSSLMPVTTQHLVAAAATIQTLKHSLSVRLDKLGFAPIPKPAMEPYQTRRIESDACFDDMQEQGASDLELERARLTGVFGFFCICQHGNTSGGCEQVVMTRGTRCIRCSSCIELLWFVNAAECRCHCSHCLGGSTSDSDDEEPLSTSSMGPATPEGGCRCRNYVLGTGWTVCTGIAGEGNNWCPQCWDADCPNKSGPCTASAVIGCPEYLSLSAEAQASPIELTADAREAIRKRRQGVDPNPKLGGCSRDDDNEADNSQIPRQGLNIPVENFNALASHAIQLTLPAVSFSLEEILETDSNGSIVWMNSSDSHQAIRNVVRRLNHWYYSGLAFSDSNDMESADLLRELVQLTNIRHWQSLVEHVARIWYNTAMSCRAVLGQVGHWKWSVNKMLSVWRTPIKSTQCATLNPTVAQWMERIEHLRAATYKTHSASAFPDFIFNSIWPSPYSMFDCPRGYQEYMTIECFQGWALRTRAEATIIEVWAKLSELSADRAHHTTIIAAINEAWHCHTDPDERMSDAISKLRQLTLLNNFVYLDQEKDNLEKAQSLEEQLIKSFKSGSELVLASKPQTPKADRARVSNCYRSISPSSSFERFSPIRLEQRGNNTDWPFDWTVLSPSWPVALQRNYDLSPLAQLRQSRTRWTTSEDESAWNDRIRDRFPKVVYRVSNRQRRKPTMLTMSVSHSSMDTDVSSSVSPGGFTEAAGLNRRQQQRGPSRQALHSDSIPTHLRMPTQAETNKTFARVRQTKLLWSSSKLAKETSARDTSSCLLCNQDFTTAVCKLDSRREKEFCNQCWTGSRAKCKEMLGLSCTPAIHELCTLVVLNSNLSVLSEQTPDGKQTLPSINATNWSEAATEFAVTLGLACSSVIKLRHPEGSTYKPNTSWVLATADSKHDEDRLSPSLPHWSWISREHAADEVRIADGYRIESSVGYLTDSGSKIDMVTTDEPRSQPCSRPSSSSNSSESSCDSDSARLDRQNGDYCNCPKGCRVETEDRFCCECYVDTDGKVHCDCDCTMCNEDLVFEVFGVNEAELDTALAEELEHPINRPEEHRQERNRELHKVKFAPVLQQLRNRISNGNWVSGPQKIIGAWFNMETFTPVARNKISNAKQAGCQWPKEYVGSQMHICNNQAVAHSGGLNRTIEEGTSSEVKFSLTHFSRHYSERDTASDPTDSDTNEGETGPASKEGKTGPVSEEKAELVSEPASEKETDTISEGREFGPSKVSRQSCLFRCNAMHDAQVTGPSDCPTAPAWAVQQPARLESDDSLKHLVFTDCVKREVWNQFNQKSFLEFEIGVIHEISKYLPTTTDGFDQVMETICRYTYNCYWKGSSHPFIEYIVSKPQLPRQSIPRCTRTLGPFANALQSTKAFDLTCHPDGPQSHHVVITAKLRNKRDVTIYYFKVEPTSCIDALKRVIEAEEGLNAHHQQWYSSITGKEASPGPFDATRVGGDESLNGMAYYLQQGELYLKMSNHSKKNWVPPASRKANGAKRLMRKPDATWPCRRYKPFEPEQPSGKDANRMNWSYAANTPTWATATVTQLLGTKAISEPRWATAIDLTQYFH